MNIDLLHHVLRITASWQNIFEVSTFTSHVVIAKDRLLGPNIRPPRRTGAVYRDFLWNVLPDLLQDVQTGIR
jgi:hypothetical protein